MPRTRILIAVIAAAAVLAGAIGLLAGGSGSSRPPVPAKQAGGGAGGYLAAAAAYLGVTRSALRAELRGGRSLAQIAQATPGRTRAGLVEALVAAASARLRAAAAAGRLSSEQLAARLAHVRERVVREVERVRAGPAAQAGLDLRDAAAYLGTTPTVLRSRLSGSRTLAQLADTTPGHSAAGLIDALVAARSAKLRAQAAAGHLSASRLARLLAKLRGRVTAAVNRPADVAAPGPPARRRHGSKSGAGSSASAGSSAGAPAAGEASAEAPQVGREYGAGEAPEG